MRAFLILYVMGVLALNFQLEGPIIFYLAMTAFPVTVYLLVSRSKKKQAAPPQEPMVVEEEDPDKANDFSFELNKPQSSH
ncbi:MAG: hypothetical protein EOO14_23975 [Chitinophagaceae bacterium]|nr:MAG: hypothetical protein EOO14_23975 [Chitinophagaceae bacterium]